MEYEEYIVKVYENKTKWFNKEGQVHRIGGPAVEYADGDKFWFQNDKRHKLDGPAIELVKGYKEYWIEGKKYTEEEFLKKTSPIKEYTVSQICELLGYEVKIVKE